MKAGSPRSKSATKSLMDKGYALLTYILLITLLHPIALQIEHREKLLKIAGGDAPASALPERPQRFSTTSGLEQGDAGKRTWTVGDVEDDSETHRGGRKHIRGKKGGAAKASKVWGTGVNAIPVG